MGAGDWKDSGYRRLLGRTEDSRTSHTHKLQELGGFCRDCGMDRVPSPGIYKNMKIIRKQYDQECYKDMTFWTQICVPTPNI
jgi:hypothetical protein